MYVYICTNKNKDNTTFHYAFVLQLIDYAKMYNLHCYAGGTAANAVLTSLKSGRGS